jgi:outer membrane protein insertion porin family
MMSLLRSFSPAPGLALLAASLCWGVLGSERDYEGKRISEVLFEPATQPVGREQLGISLRIRPGDVFDARELSAAIERLYLTGRFEDIAVDASSGPDGVVLTFKTIPKYFVGRVTVSGVPEPPNTARLINTAKFDIGTEFMEDEVPGAVSRLTDLLRANGFSAPRVTWQTTHREETNETNIHFVVEPGPRANFARPILTGDLQQTEDKLVKTLGWQGWSWKGRVWRPYNEARLERGLEKLRSLYLNKDFLQARIAVQKLDWDTDRNVVIPHLEVLPGPKVSVNIEGAKVSKGNLRTLIPVYQERTVDRELLVEGRRNLEDYFQAQGYFDATVDFDQPQDPPGEQETITFTVNRGPRYELAEILISGNRYFDSGTVRERMNSIPGGKFRNRRGRFSRSLLDGDRETIADLYRSNGFREVQVRSQVEKNYNGKALDLAIRITVEEGRQWFVSAVDVSGVDLALLSPVEGLLTLTSGQPFSPAGLAADRDAILNYYFNNGYHEATLDNLLTPDELSHTMKVAYTVREGRRTRVRQVLISGLQITRPSLVTERLTFGPGDPLSQAQLVEAQRRLYDLGIFSKVDIAVQNPDGGERDKYVLVQLDEAKKYSLTLGAGAELGRIGGDPNSLTSPAGATGFSPRALIGITRLNFMGTGHTAGITSRFSSFQRRVLLNYTAPQFRGSERFSLSVNGLYDYSRDVRTYTAIRYEAGIQLLQRLNRSDSFQYRLTYRHVKIPPDSLVIDPALIPLYSQPVRVGLVSTTYVRDRRDNPLDSTRGSFNSLDVGWATRYLGSETQYVRMAGRNSTYYKLGKDLVLARTLSFGWLYNYAATPIPLPEKFYAGGSSTHRGFPDNQAGPRDLVTGFPIGGDAYLLIGTELRFPLIGRTVDGVVFHDAGNVYTNLDTISFRYHQRNEQDFDYMVQAPGIGLRIRTPLGPVRVDFAYGLNSPRFFGYEGTREDLINGIGTTSVRQRVNPFQFHFSLGQTF